MIKPAFRALLVPGVGPPPLLEASLLAASGAAIAMAAVAVRADEKHRATLFAHANSLPENPFAVNRHHAFSQAGGRQRQRLRGRLEPAEFGRPHEGRRTRNPVALTAGFLHFPAFPDTITPCSQLVDDWKMTAPSAPMMSLPSAEVQKTTFSDDHRHRVGHGQVRPEESPGTVS